MDSIPSWYIYVGAIGGAVVLFLASRWWERRRTEALRDACLRLGMLFSDEDPELENPDLQALPLFQQGRSRKISNVGRGSESWVFGYRFTTGSGRNSSTHSQTVAAFKRSGAGLPSVRVGPEGLFDRLGVAFGGQDIDFEDTPEFSKRYRVRAEEEDAARRVLTLDLRQRLTAEKDWSLEFAGDWIVAYRQRQRAKPADLVQFVSESSGLASLIS